MTTLPYLTSPGNLSKAFTAIQMAATPPKVSQDFVKTVLGIPGGSGDNMTTFLKRIGFAASDGSPSDRYKQFRNQQTAGGAVAAAMKEAYAEVFKRNEFAHLLPDADLKGHIVEITGNAADSRPVSLTVSTFKNMNEYADFDDTSGTIMKLEENGEFKDGAEQDDYSPPPRQPKPHVEQLGLNIGYTINLNLPATSDVKVFNAIFKSLKENLLSSDDT